jgi:peptidyl-prolyl cis-trans isomerase SurA
MREVQKKITSNIKVTPADVREYFKNIPQDSLPFIPTQVEVQIITSTPEVSRQEIERIEDRLREFARRVNDGESDFSTLAMLYSQDGSARMGGELGYNGRNQWVPEFANVAFSLNSPKKVSKIVRTEFGFHIIQLIDKKGDKVNVRHILLKPEIEDSEYTKALARLDSIVVDIKEGDFSFEDAASVLSDDKDTRNNNGLMFYQDKEKYTRTSRFKMEELPQEIAKVVNNMQIGDISKAFILNNEKGQKVCAVVKLKNRIEGHYANTTEDFQVLKDVVLEKKRNEKIEQWIKEKIQKTYIKIDPEWKNCEFKYSGWIK